MKLLVDMNLPPAWVKVFEQHGWQAVHWSTIGDPRATDRAIILGFGTILAVTHADGPSVLQVRTQDVLPEHLADIVLTALQQFAEHLDAGALITIDENTSRARILPISG